MDLEKEEKIHLVNNRIKALNGKINIIDTEEDSGESLEDIQAKIQALTNLLEMI